MKSIDTDKIENISGKKLGTNDTFMFDCNSELSCFNQCCRNLNLFLYPYDVLRLKNFLKISSDQFLDKYVDVVMRASNFFPEVLLKMSENKDKTCPFLTEQGCSVYLSRPDTCRTFPIEQAMLYDAKTKKKSMLCFFRPPDFCLGPHENRIWTTSSWAKDQNAVIYNKMTLEWADVKQLFQSEDPWGTQGPEGAKAKMAFMASYNIDRFREFVFKSSFLKRYKIKKSIIKKIRKSETELLIFGFEWIRFFIWGIHTDSI